MIKFFRRIRQRLLSENKFSKYLLYAIGEIILVVIGILIALSINNWNQNQKEKKQIRNIYVRIVQDFNQTASEIERDVTRMDNWYPLMINILKGEVVRDSLLTNSNYFHKYWNCTTGFPDIKVNDAGIRLLESKIELNFELNTELAEALTLLYTEQLFELEIDTKGLTGHFERLANYLLEKGVRVDYNVYNDRTTFTNMVLEDNTFKNYYFPYQRSYKAYSNRLKNFKAKGAILIDEIKAEYNIE